MSREGATHQAIEGFGGNVYCEQCGERWPCSAERMRRHALSGPTPGPYGPPTKSPPTATPLEALAQEKFKQYALDVQRNRKIIDRVVDLFMSAIQEVYIQAYEEGYHDGRAQSQS